MRLVPRVRDCYSRMVRLFVVLTSAILMMAVPAWAQNGRPVHLSAESVLLLAPDGTVLFAKNPSEDHAPASLVKLMTLYLACEDLEAGRVAWEEPVAISRRAAETPRYRMGLRAGDSVPFRTLLEGVAIASANDAATAVAEHLAGTEEAFVERMNAKTVELGLRATRFVNAHGLPGPGQGSTALPLPPWQRIWALNALCTWARKTWRARHSMFPACACSARKLSASSPAAAL